SRLYPTTSAARMAVRRRSMSVAKLNFQKLQESYHSLSTSHARHRFAHRHRAEKKTSSQTRDDSRLTLPDCFEYSLKSWMAPQGVKIRIVLNPSLLQLVTRVRQYTFQ